MVRRRAQATSTDSPDRRRRGAGRRPRSRPAARPGAAGGTEDEQPRARPVGVHGADAGGTGADDPGDRDGRPERGDRARRPGRAGSEAGGAGRDLRRGRPGAPDRRAAGGRRGPGGGRGDAARSRSSARGCGASWVETPPRRRSPASTAFRRESAALPPEAGAADLQTATVLSRARDLGIAVAAILIVEEAASGERIADCGARGGGEARRRRRRAHTLSLKSRLSLCRISAVGGEARRHRERFGRSAPRPPPGAGRTSAGGARGARRLPRRAG